MKFEMTRCKYCGSEMLMGATLCPSCGQTQTGYGKRAGFYQPGVVLAVALSAAVLSLLQLDQSADAACKPTRFTAIRNASFPMMTAIPPVSA